MDTRFMNIGKLNKRISIGEMKEDYNDNGFPVTDFVEDFKTYARVKNLSGKQFYEAKAANLENIVEFTIRYRKDFNANKIIQFNGENYEIIHINNVDFSNKFLIIKARIVNKEGV